MITIDDILPLVGMTLDEPAIERLFGERGHKFSDKLDPSHPEDQRHYFTIPNHSLEMILGNDDAIDTIFFYLCGKKATYPWTTRSGLGRDSSRNAVLAAIGTPERSGKSEARGDTGCIGFDRFKIGRALLHFEYEDDCNSVRLITAMSAATRP